jgi:hypothetical protein
MGNFLTPITTRIKNAQEGARSPAKCWKGYERVPGTKKLTPGSCKKK